MGSQEFFEHIAMEALQGMKPTKAEILIAHLSWVRCLERTRTYISNVSKACDGGGLHIEWVLRVLGDNAVSLGATLPPMPKIPVAYEKPSGFKQKLHQALEKMGVGDPLAVIESEREYIDAAHRAGVDPVSVAGIVYRTHKNPITSAACPPPKRDMSELRKKALAATKDEHKFGTHVLVIDRIIDIETLSEDELVAYARERGVVEAHDSGPSMGNWKFRAKGQMANSRNVYNFVRPDMKGQLQELFVVIGLSTQVEVVSYDLVAKGQVDRVSVVAGDVIRPVNDSGAKSFIACHNHPSGHAEPSDSDAYVTEQLEEASKLMGVIFLDHMVIGDGEFYSFRDRKLTRVRR